MEFRLKISKKLVLRLMLFAAITGAAMLFDIYFESHPGALKELKSGNEDNKKEQSVVYLISQTSTLSVKPLVQNAPGRKLFSHEHSKFVMQCHQLRNHLAYKAEKKVPRKPVFLSCHNLLFKQNYFSLPDDDTFHS